MGRAPYLLTIVVAVGATSYLYTVRRADQVEASQRQREAAAQVASVSDKLTELERSVAAGRAIGLNPTPAPAIMRAVESPASSGGAPTPPPPMIGANAPPRSPPTAPEIRDVVDARFYGQRGDSGWSADATQRAKAMVAPILPAGSAMVGVECRSTMCRVETRHRDLDTYREFLKSGVTSSEFNWDGPSMTTILRTENSGEIVSVAYLGRDGSGPLVDEDEVNAQVSARE